MRLVIDRTRSPPLALSLVEFSDVSARTRRTAQRVVSVEKGVCMKILLVPGQASSNKIWLNTFRTQLDLKFLEIQTIEYDHWSQEKREIDIASEVEKICEFAKLNQEYVIIAKSIGITLSLLSSQKGILSPKAAVFLGSPIRKPKVDYFVGLFSSIKFPVLFIQQDSDPIVSSNQLYQYIKSSNRTGYTLKSIIGNDHGYDDFSQITPIVNNWLNHTIQTH